MAATALAWIQTRLLVALLLCQVEAVECPRFRRHFWITMRPAGLYRSRFVWSTNVVIFGAIFAAGALAALLSTRLGARLFPAGLCVFDLGMLAWASRLGVRAEPSGVRVVNMLRRPRLRWDEIDRFELAPGGIYPFVGWVVLKNHHRIAITAITVSRFAKERSLASAQEAIDALNDELRIQSQQDSAAVAR